MKKICIICFYTVENYISMAFHIKLYNIYNILSKKYNVDVYINTIEDSGDLNNFYINNDLQKLKTNLFQNDIDLEKYSNIIIIGDFFKNPYFFWNNKISELISKYKNKIIGYDCYLDFNEFKENSDWKLQRIYQIKQISKIYSSNIIYNTDTQETNIFFMENLLCIREKYDYLNNISRPNFLQKNIYNICVIHPNLSFKNKKEFISKIKSDNVLYDITYQKLSIEEFLYCIYNAETIYTIDYDLIILCKILGKKCIYPEHLDYRFQQLQNITLNKISLNFFQKTIDSDYNYDDSIHIKYIKNNDILLDIKNNINREKNVSIFLYKKENIDIHKLNDICIIQCHYGSNQEQINATKKAIDLMILYTDPKPTEWIFVEAQENDNDFQFKYLENFGIKYIQKYIHEKNKYIFQKEALWNLAVLHTNCNKLCFIDSDIVFCKSDWLISAYNGFDEYTFFQIHSYSYRALQKDSDGLRESISHQHFNYKNKNIYSYNNFSLNGHTGFDLCMTKETWNKIQGIRVLSTTGGDCWNWCLLIGGCNGFKYYYSRYSLPYNLDLTHSLYSIADLYGIDRKIGCCNEICLHINHGALNERYYESKSSFGRMCTTYPYEDLNYKYNNNKLAEWSDNKCGLIHHKCAEIFSKSNNRTIEYCCEIYDHISEDYYGKIDQNNDLVIATSFQEGFSCKSDVIYIMKDLYEQYCQTKFQFIVFTNSKLNGINTIPFELNIENRPVFWNQIEMFRNIFTKNTSILMLDSDVIPLKKFKLHQCPLDKIHLKLELNNNSNPNSRSIWNAGSIYYRGDYSFIFNQFKSDINSRFNPLFNYASSQEYIQNILYKYNKEIENIDQHFRICFPTNDYSQPSEYYQACHFITYKKPWLFNKNQMPKWCPYPILNQG